MKTNLKITAVTPDNFELVLPLISAYQEFYRVQPSPEKNREYFRQFTEGSSRGKQFLALDEAGNAVGFITLYFSPSSLSARDFCLLNDLYAVPGARSRGVGRALTDFAIEYARKAGYACLDGMTEVSNVTAQALYDQYPASRSQWYYYSLPLDTIH